MTDLFHLLQQTVKLNFMTDLLFQGLHHWIVKLNLMVDFVLQQVVRLNFMLLMLYLFQHWVGSKSMVDFLFSEFQLFQRIVTFNLYLFQHAVGTNLMVDLVFSEYQRIQQIGLNQELLLFYLYLFQ